MSPLNLCVASSGSCFVIHEYLGRVGSNERMETRNWTIGADLCCDVVINDDCISPRHCVVIHESGRWYVQPLEGRLKIDNKMVTGRIEINSATSVWLSPQIRLPWPSAIDSVVLTVGRALDCDITLESPGVSGRHAKLLIGPQGTMVLEDWQSKNGLRLDGNPASVVKAVALQYLSNIFFGASPFSTTTLVERANLIANPMSAGSPSFGPDTEPRQKELKNHSPERKQHKKRDSTSLFLLKYFFSFCGPAILLGSMYAVGWLPFLSTKQPTEVVASQPMAIPAETRAPEIVVVQQPPPSSLPTVVRDPLPVPPPSVEPTVAAVTPSQCVYWVVVKHRETGNWFRLGSAVAIGDKTLLTVGSVAQAAFQTSEGDYEAPSVVHVLTGKMLPIENHRVHPQLAKRMAVADKANADRQKMLAESTANKRAVEEVTKLVNVSMSAVAAVDCATLQVPQIVPFLVLDAKTKLRPKQRLRVISFPFPVNEPYWDQNLPSIDGTAAAKISELIGRVDAFGLTLEGVPGQTIAILDAAEADLNWFGCPAVNDANQLIGITLYSETKQTQTGSVQLELLSPSVAEKMLNKP